MKKLNFKGKKVGAILACNEVQKYLDWLPYAATAWEKNGVVPVIILINHDTIPSNIKNKGWDIRILPEIDSVITSYQSQIVRLFYPAILTEYDAIITSDVDTMCLPTKSFFEKYINESIEDNKFIAMRYNHPQIFIPWNIAPPKIWNELMDNTVNSIDDVLECIKSLYKQAGGYENSKSFEYGNNYWGIDQIFLTQQVLKYANSFTKLFGQVNGMLTFKRTPDVDLAHHAVYCTPYINNDKVKICDKLDYYGAGVDANGKLIEAGSYQWNHKQTKEISLEDLDSEKHVTFGTGNAAIFPQTKLDWILNNIWK